MAVAASIAQGHPGSRRRRRRVQCSEATCGDTREVSFETHRRIVNGELSGLCPGCRGVGPKVEPSEADRQFWLVRFGVPADQLRGTTATAYIAQHGMPDELNALAASLRKT